VVEAWLQEDRVLIVSGEWVDMMSCDKFSQRIGGIRTVGWPCSSLIYVCKNMKKGREGIVMGGRTSLIGCFWVVVCLIGKVSDGFFAMTLRTKQTKNKVCLILI